jgi:hypothetical protein
VLLGGVGGRAGICIILYALRAEDMSAPFPPPPPPVYPPPPQAPPNRSLGVALIIVFVLLLLLGIGLAAYSETYCFQVAGSCYTPPVTVYPYTGQAEIVLVLSFIALVAGLVFFLWNPSPPVVMNQPQQPTMMLVIRCRNCGKLLDARQTRCDRCGALAQ